MKNGRKMPVLARYRDGSHLSMLGGVAIRTGQRLTREQKAALIAVYRSVLQTEPAQDLEPAFRDRALSVK